MAGFKKHKVVFLGDESVGKSSIITRYMDDKFDPAYRATVGYDFWSKIVYMEDRIVWLKGRDTGGQERFRSMIPSYIRYSSFAVIVYDVTNRQSFLNISKWIEEVRRELGRNVIIVLVGNKADHLVYKIRQVSIEEGDGKAREIGAMFLETSARDGFNIKKVFLLIALNVEGYGSQYNNPSGRNPSNLGNQQRSPQVHKLAPPNKDSQHKILTPQTSSSGKSLEEIVKNLAITQQQYQQDTRASLKYLEKTIAQLVASIEKLEAKGRFPSQTEVNLKQNNPRRKES